MPTVLSVLLSIAAVTISPVPEGTPLHVRLTSTVGSYASAAGSAVSAVLIAPVVADGVTLMEAGSTLSGKVKAVRRVGFGLRHETAGLDLEFNQLTPANGTPVPISAQVAEVDNGRERVNQKGRIEGVRSTSSMCYRVSGYIRTALQWEIHADIAVWAIRSVMMQLPEPEIYYPAGVELTLTLTKPLFLDGPIYSREPAATNSLIAEEELQRIVEAVPYRTQAPVSKRSSDFTNVLFVGSQEQIEAAFTAAGWTQARPPTLRSRIRWIRAVAELRGDGSAPMSPLLLEGAEPDMSWQKGLNDVSKRHHIRVWKDPDKWQGREIWVGAATRDVDFAYLRPGRRLTHRIEENIDQERDKVAYDLAFTSCGSLLGWPDRSGSPRSASNATGDPMSTDGHMVVIGMNDCPEPRLATESVDESPIPEHGGAMQRFARREILSARNELLRTNLVWRTYEVSRWLYEYIQRQRQRQESTRVRLAMSSQARASAALTRGAP